MAHPFLISYPDSVGENLYTLIRVPPKVMAYPALSTPYMAVALVFVQGVDALAVDMNVAVAHGYASADDI